MKRSRKRCTVRSPAGAESKANLPPMKMIPVLLLIAALGAAAFAQDEKPAPAEVAAIPQAAKARLSLEVEADNIKWAQRALVAPFKARLKGEAWNAEASAFVGHALEYWADLNIASRRVGGLSAEGKKVTAAGCKDPLVLYFSGAIQFADTGEWRAGLSEMEEALKLVEADKSCPLALAHFIARNLGMRVEKSGKQVKDIAVKTAGWIAEEWKDGSYQPGDEAIFVHHEMGRWRHIFPEDAAKTQAAYEGAPLPPWARITLVAALRDQQEQVWKSRNPNKTRPPEIVAHATAAYDGFAEAWKLNPAEPWAAAEASRYTHGKDKAAREPDRREWFDRAVAAQFDLDAAYRHQIRALSGTGGSTAKLLAFGRACLDTRRFETPVPSYFRVAASIVAERKNDSRTVYEDPEIARPLIVLCLSKLRENSPGIQRDSWASWLAVYAWLGGEPLHAERALAELKDGLTPEAVTLLRRMQLDETVMRGEISLAKAGLSDELATVRRRLAAGESGDALGKIGALEKKAVPEAANLMRALRARAEFETEFAKGEWVRLVPPDHLDGWSVISGKWDALGGVITLKGGDTEAVLLAPGRVGKHYELRCEMDIECGTNCCRSFGVMCSYLRPNFGLALSTDQQGAFEQKARVWGMVGRTIPNAPEPASSLKPANKFHVRVDDRLLTMELNGTRHFDDYEFDYTKIPSDGRFGFVVMKACAANSWRIKNIEVRKLPAR